jgi:uncharacterized protein (DUF736 family)
MPAIGYVTRQEDGSFKGQLTTLTIRADVEIIKNRTKNTESWLSRYRCTAAGRAISLPNPSWVSRSRSRR